MKIILPFLLLGLAAVIFFYFTSPRLAEIETLQIEKAKLVLALEHANELKQRQDELSEKYNTIEEVDRNNLDNFLPNNIDNVRLIIDINDIAKIYGLTIRNPNIAKEETKEAETAAARNVTKVGVNSAVMNFSVSASYEILKLFLSDLARSLRLVDLESVSFSSNDRNLYDYTISLRTYWLK